MDQQQEVVLKVTAEQAWIITTALMSSALISRQHGHEDQCKLFHELGDKVRHQLEFQQK